MADVFAGVVDAAGPAIPFTEISGAANADPFPAAVADTAAADVPALVGAVAYPDSAIYADVPAVVAGNFLFDYYYRIWVLPEVLNAQNPIYDVPIPFAIWNAFPQPLTNTLESIDRLAATGLSLDIDVGAVFRAVEYRVVNVTITPAAGLTIAAEFDFNFDAGTGRFFFNATIADFVQMVPDPPVTETWAWLTDVIPSRDNTEQRIALRSTPRRTIKYGFLLEDETERRRQYQRWYKSLGNPIVLPFYQYHTKLVATSLEGSSKLYFDPAKTDMRDGDFVIVMNEATVTGHLVKIDSVDPDGATTNAPLQFDATKGLLVAPTFTSRLNDNTGLSMKSVTGHLDVAAMVLTYRASFKRPGSTAVIPTFDGMPVLNLRPIAAGETPEVFDANYDVVDSTTGIQRMYVSWPHPVVGGTRKWTIRRRQNPAEMDWWRDFLDTIKGQWKAFLMPTWFADLTLAELPTVGTGQLRITNADYASLYFPFDTFQRLQLETDAGILWRKVLAATQNPDGTTTLQLDIGFASADEVAIAKVSFLNRCRLNSDTVTLTHERLRTQIELPTRTVDL
jgi:hypothetical protein